MTQRATATAPGSDPQQDGTTRHTPADVPVLVSEMAGWFDSLKRSLAGFSALHGALLNATGKVPDGERKLALPMLEFKAPLVGRDSREVVTCAVDLRKVQAGYAPHVLVPLLNVVAGELLESMEEIQEHLDLIRPLLSTMMAPPSQQADPA